MTRFLAIALVLIAGVATRPAQARLDPWVLYDQELKTLFATDGCVRVRKVESPDASSHVIRVDVCDDTQAQALATLLKPSSLAEVRVFGPGGTELAPGAPPTEPRAWVRIFDRALGGNCLFVRSFVGQAGSRTVAFVEIAKTAVQFYGANEADPNGNLTLLAALGWFDVLSYDPGFQLFTSADFVWGCGGKP